ncbi:ABC transporter ATP-binding protein [Aquibaculum arenosum]|uniref:Spermidine/putrescine import ATP-binding protein PotA n=1 Tax=Aquibaculum arenosum TaxID=3032591 RepID=A0ABT5YL20_9PROT|nr:ABC transporter ATP-binding protein [Fodinicurvata sp. CAU 1616]MDF2095645.1 ABC transporter ATP-binding protein [Fodinicurvata sp. CAU 1616]
MSESNDAFVRFINVQKSYDGETLVVKNLNLDIAKGEFVTMLGPSGSGKTTCLMMLAGFETATSGEIMLNGRGINKVAPHKRGIGMVFQNYALFPHMTVAENLAFPLQVRKVSKAETEQKVQRALDMVQLGHLGNRRPAQLSGGQQQRVAVARALVFDPDLVLMDEPLGALDKNLREQMQYEIKHIHESLGVTVVYVTHDQSEALTMSNRIAVFDDGVIQQLAPPPDLYERPLNAFVAAFIGENNQLHGKVVEIKGDDCKVQLDDGSIIHALKVNVDKVGDRTTLSLRPERVAIAPPEGQYPNVFEARVEELIYLGDHIRTRVSLCGTDEFIVKIPNAHAHASIARGETVQVGWAMEDCRALDAS